MKLRLCAAVAALVMCGHAHAESDTMLVCRNFAADIECRSGNGKCDSGYSASQLMARGYEYIEGWSKDGLPSHWEKNGKPLLCHDPRFYR